MFDSSLALMHHYVLGETQTGKTTLLLNSALQEMNNGFIFFDVHGETTNKILERLLPDIRLYIYDPTIPTYSVGFNPLEYDDVKDIPYTVTALLDTLKIVAQYKGGTALFEQAISNSAYAVISQTDNTLLNMLLFLEDKLVRSKTLKTVKDKLIKKYWTNFNKRTPKRQEDITSSAISQLYLLLADPRIRYTLAQKKSAFRFKDIMSYKTVFLIKLPVTELGPDKVKAIGSLMLSQIYSALGKRTFNSPFNIYIDDAQYFATLPLANLLSVAGRYNVHITLAHQFLDQIEPDIRSSFLGNTTLKTLFRTSIADAKILEKTLEENNTYRKLYELKPFTARIVTPKETRQEDMPPLEVPPRIDDIQKLINITLSQTAKQITQIQPDIDKIIGG